MKLFVLLLSFALFLCAACEKGLRIKSLIVLICASFCICSCGEKTQDIEGPSGNIQFDKTYFLVPSQGGRVTATGTTSIMTFEVSESIWENNNWTTLYGWNEEGVAEGLLYDVSLKEASGKWFHIKIKDKPDNNILEIDIDENMTGEKRRVSAECMMSDGNTFIDITIDQEG